MWAPPPFDAPRSRPLLTSEAGWPATAPALYNLSAHDYVQPPLDFEVSVTNARPYAANVCHAFELPKDNSCCRIRQGKGGDK